MAGFPFFFVFFVVFVVIPSVVSPRGEKMFQKSI
jgi:hypothetical protein